MKSLIASGVLAAAAVGLFQIPASAQTPSSAYRYCLMSGSHRDTVGMVLCRFDTLAQCMASRNGFGDTCYINPEFTGRRK
jgi:hypothetical protein